MLPQIQVMPLISLRISLADNVQFSLQAGFIQWPAIRHPYHPKGDSRLIRRSSVAIVRSPNTCATTVFRRLSYVRVKQPALARFSPDVSPLFVHFRADDDVTARLYAREYRLRPEFFKCRKIVLKPTPIMRALARHPTPFMAISIIFWCVPG